MLEQYCLHPVQECDERVAVDLMFYHLPYLGTVVIGKTRIQYSVNLRVNTDTESSQYISV